MGERGFMPLSADKLAVRGSSLVASRRRAEQARTVGTGGRIACPSWLSVEGRVVWRQTVAGLRPFGHLRPADANGLGRYAATFVLWRKLVEARDVLGDGDPTAVRLERRALKVSEALLRLESSFGMNPASRARLGLATVPTVRQPDSRLLRLLPQNDPGDASEPDDDPGDDSGGDIDPDGT